MYKRILAIGDIHGEWDKFVSLYRQIDFQPGRDLLVFLGDYIDRGSAPLHVLKWLFAHKNNEHIIILRSNHEQMMLDYYREGECNNLWLWNGGDVTRDALDEEDSTLKEDFLRFIEELPLSYRIVSMPMANTSSFAMPEWIPIFLWSYRTRKHFCGYGRSSMIIMMARTSLLPVIPTWST